MQIWSTAGFSRLGGCQLLLFRFASGDFPLGDGGASVRCAEIGSPVIEAEEEAEAEEDEEEAINFCEQVSPTDKEEDDATAALCVSRASDGNSLETLQ